MQYTIRFQAGTAWYDSVRIFEEKIHAIEYAFAMLSYIKSGVWIAPNSDRMAIPVRFDEKWCKAEMPGLFVISETTKPAGLTREV